MGRELILVLGPCWSKLWPGADCGPGANFSAGAMLEQILAGSRFWVRANFRSGA